MNTLLYFFTTELYYVDFILLRRMYCPCWTWIIGNNLHLSFDNCGMMEWWWQFLFLSTALIQLSTPFNLSPNLLPFFRSFLTRAHITRFFISFMVLFCWNFTKSCIPIYAYLKMTNILFCKFLCEEVANNFEKSVR